MKKFDKVLLALGTVALASASWVSLPAAQQPAQAREMCTDLVVSSSYAYMKAGPGMAYRTLRTAGHNEALTLTGTQPRGGWNEVKSSNGTTGWVHDSVIRCRSGVISKMTCSQVRVTGPQGAYLKALPTLNSHTFRVARNGETFYLESPGNPIESRSWYLVRNGAGIKYWVHDSVIACK